MKKLLVSIGFVAICAAAFVKRSEAQSTCTVACSRWVHRLSGNGQPPDCLSATKRLIGSAMSYYNSTPSPLPPPFDAPIIVTYEGKVQPGSGPAGIPACPAYIENGNWHH